MKKLFILLILNFTLLTSFAQTQHFYTSAQLSSNQITNICQDQEGYIWIGTEYGLNKYDGYTFTNYLFDKDNPASISSNVIVFLFCDSKGNLWVGTTKGLDLYDDANDQFIHVKMNGAKSVPRVNYIIQAADGTKYRTGSDSFWRTFMALWEDLEGEEGWEIKCYRLPSKNRPGKDFLTCSLV